LLEHIAVKGPAKSSDFERTSGEGGGWWGWKDEKRWLETLFASGELMVARRDNFHRVYDLSGRVAPQVLALESNGGSPDSAQVHARFIERSIAALGITQARWVNDYFRIKPRLKDADLDALVTRGTAQRVRVEGWGVPAISAKIRMLPKRPPDTVFACVVARAEKPQYCSSHAGRRANSFAG